MRIEAPAWDRIPELRRLWQAVFQDPGDYLDRFFEKAFSPDRCRCVMENGEVAAMAHWFTMYQGERRAAYLYAVATRRSSRGRGHCRRLLEEIHSLLGRQGYAWAILVPEDEGLAAMYARMGYRHFGGVRRIFSNAGPRPAALTPIGPARYQALRQRLLPEGGVMLDDTGADFLGALAELYEGPDFLLAAVREGEMLHGIELLGSAAGAPGILTALGCVHGSFLLPGHEPFAMCRGLDDSAPPPRYFGIAFD